MKEKKYCKFCGKSLIKKEFKRGFDEYAGTPNIIKYIMCPDLIDEIPENETWNMKWHTFEMIDERRL